MSVIKALFYKLFIELIDINVRYKRHKKHTLSIIKDIKIGQLYP